MRQQLSSLTAEGVAFGRAFEATRPEGERLCDDPLARRFISGWVWVVGKLFYVPKQRRGPGVAEFIIVRCRYMDDYLRSCLPHIEQLVILGAGFDSRAYRTPGIEGHIKVFEVDHPATQRVKVARVRKIFGQLPAHVVYVPVDFERDTLEAALPRSGYEESRVTLFIWEGVTMYLTPAGVEGTLAFIRRHSAPGSSVIFDYVYTAALDGRIRRYEIEDNRRQQRLTGEGIGYGIEQGTLGAFLGERGFVNVVDAGADDLRRLYFTGPNAGRPLSPVYGIVHAEVPAAP